MNVDFLKKRVRNAIFLTLSILLLISCKKDLQQDNIIENSELKGIYILNQGVWNMNNCTLSYYDFENNRMENDIFLKKNGRKLGDVGNDLKKYGSKLYVILSTSETLEIIDVKSCKSLKQILLTGKNPRCITFDKNKAYLSCYDGSILCIDTSSMAIEATTTAGNNPEGMCVVNGKLYVANSGGMNYPNYDHTVSIIDLNSFNEIKKIEVALNPCQLLPDAYGNIYVIANGNYNDVLQSLQRIDTQIDEVVKTFDFPVMNACILGNFAYLYFYDFGTQISWIKVLDLTTDIIVNEQFIKDNTTIQTPYCITINPKNLDVYIADAYDYTVTGDIYCFSKQGKKKFSLEVGINPVAIVFIE